MLMLLLPSPLRLYLVGFFDMSAYLVVGCSVQADLYVLEIYYLWR
jgi:hypothetical protein